MSIELHSSRGHAFQQVMTTKDTTLRECLLCSVGPMSWSLLHNEYFYELFVRRDPDIAESEEEPVREPLPNGECIYGHTIGDFCAISFIQRYADYRAFNFVEFTQNVSLQKPVFPLYEDASDCAFGFKQQ